MSFPLAIRDCNLPAHPSYPPGNAIAHRARLAVGGDDILDDLFIPPLVWPCKSPGNCRMFRDRLVFRGIGVRNRATSDMRKSDSRRRSGPSHNAERQSGLAHPDPAGHGRNDGIISSTVRTWSMDGWRVRFRLQYILILLVPTSGDDSHHAEQLPFKLVCIIPTEPGSTVRNSVGRK